MSDILSSLDPATEKLTEAGAIIDRELDATLSGVENADLSTLLEVYFYLDWLVGYTKEVARMANKWLPIIEGRTNARMVAQDLEGIKSNGHSITPNVDVFVHVLKERQQECMAWLKANPTGRELVKEGYNPKAFQSFVKDMVEDGKQPPDFVKVTLMPSISVRKLPK